MSPQNFIDASGAFGTVDARWKAGDAPELAGAYFQHRVAMRVRRRMAERGMSNDALGRCVGQDGETIRRKLQGERRTQLADVLSWAMVLGLDSLPAWPTAAQHLFPEELRSLLAGWDAGDLRLPTLFTTLDAPTWGPVVDELVDRLTEAHAGRALHIFDEPAITDAVAQLLLRQGLGPEDLWVRQMIDGALIDIVLGTPPRITLNVVRAGPEADAGAEAAAAALRDFAQRIIRSASATGPSGERVVLCVTASSAVRSGLTDLLGLDVSTVEVPTPFTTRSGALADLVDDAPELAHLQAAELEGRVAATSVRGPLALVVLELGKLVTV